MHPLRRRRGPPGGIIHRAAWVQRYICDFRGRGRVIGEYGRVGMPMHVAVDARKVRHFDEPDVLVLVTDVMDLAGGGD